MTRLKTFSHFFKCSSSGSLQWVHLKLALDQNWKSVFIAFCWVKSVVEQKRKQNTHDECLSLWSECDANKWFMDKAPVIKERYLSSCAIEGFFWCTFSYKGFFWVYNVYFCFNSLENVGTAPVNMPKPGASMVTGRHLGCLCPKE